jgi:hypothetical protein
LWVLNRQWFDAPENAIDILGRLPENIGSIKSIGNQRASNGMVGKPVNCWQAML